VQAAEACDFEVRIFFVIGLVSRKGAKEKCKRRKVLATLHLCVFAWNFGAFPTELVGKQSVKS